MRFQRLAPKTISSYGSMLKPFINYCNANQIDKDDVNENLCIFIESYLNQLAISQNSGYCTSARAAVLNYYKSNYGKIIEYEQIDGKLVFKYGNPVLHWKITEKIQAIVNTKVRDEGEVQNQAYPITHQQLITLLDNIKTRVHPFSYLQLRFILLFCYKMMCRISNALELRFNDLKIIQDPLLNSDYLLVRITWMKTGLNLQNYKLYDLPGEEPSFVVQAYKDYLGHPLLYNIQHNPHSNGFVCFLSSIANNGGFGQLIYDLNDHIKQETVLQMLKEFTIEESFSSRVTCHSLRRGGACFRVFHAQYRMSITNICTFVKWEKPQTLSKYLCDYKLALERSPLDLMVPSNMISFDSFTPENLYGAVFERALESALQKVVNTDVDKQNESGKLLSFKMSKSISRNTNCTPSDSTAPIPRPLFISTLPKAPKGVVDYWAQWFNAKSIQSY